MTARQTDKQNGMTIRLTLCERDATDRQRHDDSNTQTSMASSGKNEGSSGVTCGQGVPHVSPVHPGAQTHRVSVTSQIASFSHESHVR